MGDKKTKCFVPECYKTVGVLFPKSSVIRKKWLRSLGLEHLVPNEKSFVCLDHFEENGQPGLERKQPYPSKSTSSTLPAEKNNLCRLCMSQDLQQSQSLSEYIDDSYTIGQAIGICLYPLQVSPNDGLSKTVCQNCVILLKSYLIFHQKCLGIYKRQKVMDQAEQNQSNDMNSDSDHSVEYLHEERLSDYEHDKENAEKQTKFNANGLVDSIEETNNDDNEKDPFDKLASLSSISVKRKYDKSDEELLRVLEGNDDVVFTKVEKPKPKNPDSNSQQSSARRHSSNSVNSETTEDARKQDAGYTENIIIEMVNDEVVPGPSRVRKRKSMNMIQGKDSDEVVIIPNGVKAIKITENEGEKKYYHSPLGILKTEVITYVFNSQFLLAGGYLYDIRLAKNNKRRLQCIVNKCPGLAYQKSVDNKGTYEEDAEVVVSHNHEMPDLIDRKRQMFYHILYGKMRKDKNFNFKQLYEDFCQLDASLTRILPLRMVIGEICKQGPSPIPPKLNSFDEFYSKIENDEFHRIHFAFNKTQFYQERFKADDGSKAVVFANRETIDMFSFSKLMYVDASFLIPSRDFRFETVTVLVWVDHCYYPILHAFVNVRSQEIYKEIFSFLYNDLAPNLRPHEIITDYEANLYYALGETYVESSIGGSIFYFAENIYKKICALGLARELEVNANLRNIYNMLLMLPLLPVNTILDGLKNIEGQARDLNLEDLTDQIFLHVRTEWMTKVTPEFFCVHRLENRINENIVFPFKKLRDMITMARNKASKGLPASTIMVVIEKLIDLEKFLRELYNTTDRKAFTKDLSSTQKKMILKAWNYIENHPMINLNQFFMKVLGYIKCMENQLWIWGFYRYQGRMDHCLIDASNFSIVNEEQEVECYEPLEEQQLMEVTTVEGEEEQQENQTETQIIEEYYIDEEGTIRKFSQDTCTYVQQDNEEQQMEEQKVENGLNLNEVAPVMMEALLDENGEVILKNKSNRLKTSCGIAYVYQ